MPYLICEECGGCYELQEGDSPEDFEACQCGGTLEYYETLPETYIDDKNMIELNEEFSLDNSYLKLNINGTVKKDIDFKIATSDKRDFLKCPSCGTLNYNGSLSCLKCGREMENEYLRQQLENSSNLPLSFTTKLGRYSLNNPYIGNPYLGAIAILCAIPLILSFGGRIGLVLTPLIILLFIFIIDKFFNEDTDYENVFSETVYFTLSFSIPAFVFLIIPASNEFGHITALVLFFCSILAILLGQLISIKLKNS